MIVREVKLVYGPEEEIGLPEAPITSSKQVVEIMRDRIDVPMETFWVLALNAKGHLQFIHCVSVGCLDAAIVHPVMVLTPLMKHKLAPVGSFILCHNHPSGDPTPSAEDRAVTRRIVAAADLLGLDIVDHVIICRDGHYSFRDNGEM